MTYRESLEKEKITLNGNDYVPLEKVKEKIGRAHV